MYIYLYTSMYITGLAKDVIFNPNALGIPKFCIKLLLYILSMYNQDIAVNDNYIFNWERKVIDGMTWTKRQYYLHQH